MNKTKDIKNLMIDKSEFKDFKSKIESILPKSTCILDIDDDIIVSGAFEENKIYLLFKSGKINEYIYENKKITFSKTVLDLEFEAIKISKHSKFLLVLKNPNDLLIYKDYIYDYLFNFDYECIHTEMFTNYFSVLTNDNVLKIYNNSYDKYYNLQISFDDLKSTLVYIKIEGEILYFVNIKGSLMVYNIENKSDHKKYINNHESGKNTITKINDILYIINFNKSGIKIDKFKCNLKDFNFLFRNSQDKFVEPKPYKIFGIKNNNLHEITIQKTKMNTYFLPEGKEHPKEYIFMDNKILKKDSLVINKKLDGCFLKKINDFIFILKDKIIEKLVHDSFELVESYTIDFSYSQFLLIKNYFYFYENTKIKKKKQIYLKRFNFIEEKFEDINYEEDLYFDSDSNILFYDDFKKYKFEFNIEKVFINNKNYFIINNNLNTLIYYKIDETFSLIKRFKICYDNINISNNVYLFTSNSSNDFSFIELNNGILTYIVIDNDCLNGKNCGEAYVFEYKEYYLILDEDSKLITKLNRNYLSEYFKENKYFYRENLIIDNIDGNFSFYYYKFKYINNFKYYDDYDFDKDNDDDKDIKLVEFLENNGKTYILNPYISEIYLIFKNIDTECSKQNNLIFIYNKKNNIKIFNIFENKYVFEINNDDFKPNTLKTFYYYFRIGIDDHQYLYYSLPDFKLMGTYKNVEFIYKYYIYFKKEAMEIYDLNNTKLKEFDNLGDAIYLSFTKTYIVCYKIKDNKFRISYILFEGFEERGYTLDIDYENINSIHQLNSVTVFISKDKKIKIFQFNELILLTNFGKLVDGDDYKIDVVYDDFGVFIYFNNGICSYIDLKKKKLIVKKLIWKYISICNNGKLYTYNKTYIKHNHEGYDKIKKKLEIKHKIKSICLQKRLMLIYTEENVVHFYHNFQEIDIKYDVLDLMCNDNFIVIKLVVGVELLSPFDLNTVKKINGDFTIKLYNNYLILENLERFIIYSSNNYTEIFKIEEKLNYYEFIGDNIIHFKNKEITTTICLLGKKSVSDIKYPKYNDNLIITDNNKKIYYNNLNTFEFTDFKLLKNFKDPYNYIIFVENKIKIINKFTKELIFDTEESKEIEHNINYNVKKYLEFYIQSTNYIYYQKYINKFFVKSYDELILNIDNIKNFELKKYYTFITTNEGIQIYSNINFILVDNLKFDDDIKFIAYCEYNYKSDINLNYCILEINNLKTNEYIYYFINDTKINKIHDSKNKWLPYKFEFYFYIKNGSKCIFYSVNDVNCKYECDRYFTSDVYFKDYLIINNSDNCILFYIKNFKNILEFNNNSKYQINHPIGYLIFNCEEIYIIKDYEIIGTFVKDNSYKKQFIFKNDKGIFFSNLNIFVPYGNNIEILNKDLIKTDHNYLYYCNNEEFIIFNKHNNLSEYKKLCFKDREAPESLIITSNFAYINYHKKFITIEKDFNCFKIEFNYYIIYYINEILENYKKNKFKNLNFYNKFFSYLEKNSLETKNFLFFIIINFPKFLIELYPYNTEILDCFLKYFEFNSNIYLNYQKENPITFVVDQGRKVYINYLFKILLEDQNFEISYKMFCKLLEFNSGDLNSFKGILNKTYINRQVIFKKKKFYLKNEKKQIIKGYNNNFIDQKFLDKITVEDDFENFFKIKYLNFSIPNNFNDAIEFLNIYSELPDELKVLEIKYIIYYYWSKIKYLKYIYFLSYIIMIAFLIAKIIYFPKNIFLYIVVITFNILIIFYEIVQFKNSKKNYFKTFDNYIDIIWILLNLTAATINQFIDINLNNFLNIAVVYLNLYKIMNLLLIFNILRRQIKLIINVLKNTNKFFLNILIYILYLSFINIVNHNPETEDKNYFYAFVNVYDMMLGGWNDNFREDYNARLFIEYFFNTFIFFIILLNLFISVVSDIFETYNENKELYDLEIINDLLIEYSFIYSYFKKIKNKVSNSNNKKYIFIANKLKPKDVNNHKEKLKILFKNNKIFKEKINNLKYKLEQLSDKFNN